MKKSDPTDPLLQAMVTLNARKSGRPVPDMSKIRNGFVTEINTEETDEDIALKLIALLKKQGFRLKED